MVFTLEGPKSRLAGQKPAPWLSADGICQQGQEGGWSPGSLLGGCPAGGLPAPDWPADLSSSLPSPGRILLVNNILWHLPALGKVRPQLLYRAPGEQPAHGAGAQRLLHAVGPKRHPAGRQRGPHQGVHLGVLGKVRGAGAEGAGAGAGARRGRAGRTPPPRSVTGGVGPGSLTRKPPGKPAGHGPRSARAPPRSGKMQTQASSCRRSGFGAPCELSIRTPWIPGVPLAPRYLSAALTLPELPPYLFPAF